MATTRDPENLQLGPGWLYSANVGTTAPTDLVSAWPAGWVQMGWTREGHTFSYNVTMEGVEVAEELDPVLYAASRREMSVAFDLAELTGPNITKAFAAAASAVTVSGAVASFEPPDLGAEVRRMLGWQSQDGSERIVWRKCMQAGQIDIKRMKAPAYASLPGTFRLEAPGGGVKPFIWLFDSVRA